MEVLVEKISKSFGSHEVLHDISFTLKKGITAFLGANGAGKSTTMNIITGVLSPDKGHILIHNIDLAKEPKKAKKIIGYLPENNPLYGDMYVKEYLEYAAQIYLPKKEVKERVEVMIEKLDLQEEYKKLIHTLSHGNKQRVGLAQALIHDPEILILDEPNNGLDPIQQLKINNLLKELSKTKTVLFSSHRLDDVSEIADHFLIINKGKLVLNEKAENISSIKDKFYEINQ
ncbi:MAG: ATP-binding cassette domain-containing protein [Dysgonomonas sp.]|nr:ATP-binding cassette domain-containing protein [Dysgonomonas sp.]